MIEPASASDEKGRITALHDLDILDTPPEDRFDRITRLAHKIFDVPIALVSLVDTQRQWFKSCVGLDASETPRGISFCGHAILGQDVFVIENATLDPRFSDNPLVTGGPKIRFYAGAPLRLHNGHTVGTLCIIAPTPRQFSQRDRALLTELAHNVIAELEDVHTAARERELRDFIETAGAIIQSVDQTGRLLLVNQAWTAALGYSSDEALGKNIFDLIHPAEHEHCRAVMAQLPTSNSPILVETVLIAKDGHNIRLSGMLSARSRPDGRWTTRGVFQDVTAQRELERVRTEVAHHVSHELKTPLSVTSLALNMLAESRQDYTPEQKQFLAIAQKGTEQSTRIAEDLLDASRSESGKLTLKAATNDLNQFMSFLSPSLNPMAAKAGLVLTVELPPQTIHAHFDPLRLQQVLTNLIGNAIKFTPKGGRIAVGARKGPDGFVEIYVQDTGPGIKKEDLNRIFDRLYQTTNKALRGEPGLGLGLHICRELITAHGGRIWVDSELGKGATFRFSLLTAAPQQAVKTLVS